MLHSPLQLRDAVGVGMQTTLLSASPYLESTRIDESYGALIAAREEGRDVATAGNRQWVLDRFSTLNGTAEPLHSPQQVRRSLVQNLSLELEGITLASESRTREFYPSYSPHSMRARATKLSERVERVGDEAPAEESAASPSHISARSGLRDGGNCHSEHRSDLQADRSGIASSEFVGVAAGSTTAAHQSASHPHLSASQAFGAIAGELPNAILAGDALRDVDRVEDLVAFSETTPRFELMQAIVGLRNENVQLQKLIAAQQREVHAHHDAEIQHLHNLHDMESRERSAEVLVLRDEIRQHEATIAHLFQLTNSIREENAALAREAVEVKARATHRETDLLNLIDKLEAQLEVAADDAQRTNAEASAAKCLHEEAMVAMKRDHDVQVSKGAARVGSLEEQQRRVQEECRSAVDAVEQAVINDRAELMAVFDDVVAFCETVLLKVARDQLRGA